MRMKLINKYKTWMNIFDLLQLFIIGKDGSNRNKFSYCYILYKCKCQIIVYPIYNAVLLNFLIKSFCKISVSVYHFFFFK